MRPEAPAELRQLQRDFRRLVTRTLPDEPALAARLVRRGDLAVYAEAYFWRLHDVLAEQHASLRRALGPAGFVALVRRYLEAHPPASHDIGQAGQHLPGFLTGWHAELARLERLHLELFVAADTRPLALAALERLDPAALAARPLRAVHAFVLLACEHDVAALWADPSVLAGPRPTNILVWRRQVEVRHRVVDSEEWEALQLLARGVPLAELGELLAGHASPVDAARQLGALLARWCADELIAE